MSNSTRTFDGLIQSQSSKEVTANALFDALSQASTYGRRESVCAGLVFGIYGGKTSSERVRISKGIQVPVGIRGTRSRRCVKCGTLMEGVGNSRQYCADCQVERGRERDREYRARKKDAA